MGARPMSRDQFRISGVRRLLQFRGRDTIERNVDDEIQFHIETRAAELTRSGMSPLDARAVAVREFGDLNMAHDELTSLDRRIENRERNLDWREAITQDLR